MKTTQVLLITVGLLFFQVNNKLQAQSFKVKSYQMTVKGTSNLHDWESKVEKVDCKGSYTLVNNAIADVKDVVLKIQVTSIKSTKGKTMDNKTYDAFKYEEHPYIVFILNSKKINEAKSTLDLKGTLSMAGATIPIDLTVNFKLLTNGELQITGSKKLNMTVFGMETPTAMLGAIQVGEEVIVTFDMTLTMNNPIL